MTGETQELAFERLLLALERELTNATDEEILEAAGELGMNPRMKGSSAFFGVTTLTLPPLLQEDPKACSDAQYPWHRPKDDLPQ